MRYYCVPLFVILAGLLLSGCEPAAAEKTPIPYVAGKCGTLPVIPFEPDSILSALKREKDHLKQTRQDTSAITPLISQVGAGKLNMWAFFPFQNFDSVLFVTVSNPERSGLALPDPSTYTSVKKLCPEKIALCSHLVNNPLFFSTEECKNTRSEGEIVYYRRGKPIASISVLCSGKALRPTPWSTLIRKGSLTDEGATLLADLKLGE